MKFFLLNKKGQFVIETVLMMIITISLFLWGMGELRESKILAKLVSGPWLQISGMIEAGVWDAPERARGSHPNTNPRSLSLDPQE